MERETDKERRDTGSQRSWPEEGKHTRQPEEPTGRTKKGQSRERSAGGVGRRAKRSRGCKMAFRLP